MAEYQDLDDATLQQMLSDATSYEERSALRQVLRARKKNRGESLGHTKPRGNSVYNRFAGSTAPKGKSASTYTTKYVPADDKTSSVSVTPTRKKDSPIQQLTTPTPPPTPDQPKSTPPADDSADALEEADATPVVVEPAEDGLSNEPEESSPTPDVPEQTVELKDDHVDDEPDVAVGEEVAASGEVDLHSTDVTEEVLKEDTDSAKQETAAGADKDLQHYLVAYVNHELGLTPPLPSRGKALFDTCSDPAALCKLINKSVSGTVDMRALSKVSGSPEQRAEAIRDNMTLVVESARAIGCRVDDSTTDDIVQKDPGTISNFLVDLIRARVVHLPGMEDEPGATFSDLPTLFQKLHISVGDEEQGTATSWRDDPEKVKKALSSPPPPAQKGSWRDSPPDSTELTYEERAARRKAEREERLKKDAEQDPVELSYEERAAQRKAERERRKREREALAK